MRNVLALLTVLIIASGAAVAEVRGMAGVPAADVLVIDGARYRLYGIDAVERFQPCYVDGEEWACGAVAIRQLEIFVANEPAVCVETGESAGDLGAWAVCSVGDSDLAEVMVRTGMAMALRQQTDRYVAAEEEAKAEGAGLWKSIFIEPWVYRRDAALIEEKIAERLRTTPVDAAKIDAIRKRIDLALIDGNGGIDVFDGMRVVRGDRNTIEREVTEFGVEKGYLTKPLMARLPDDWQTWVAGRAHRRAVQLIWSDLALLTRNEFSAPDPEKYLQVMQEQAALITAAGRTPILIMRELNDPPWTGDWFGPGAEPPDGVQVTHRDDVGSEYYMGTVNGIDVFQATIPEGESYLVSDDFLVEVRYGADADGRIVSIEFKDATVTIAGRLEFRFAMAAEWRGEEVVVLTYPPVEQEDEYE